ncbi:hypothetical protein BD413DRAFT_264889 [Trametes elegans]|nr:hypothetical protein BD413DRAFT_264889 [Trametes elegans]
MSRSWSTSGSASRTMRCGLRRTKSATSSRASTTRTVTRSPSTAPGLAGRITRPAPAQCRLRNGVRNTSTDPRSRDAGSGQSRQARGARLQASAVATAPPELVASGPSPQSHASLIRVLRVARGVSAVDPASHPSGLPLSLFHHPGLLHPCQVLRAQSRAHICDCFSRGCCFISKFSLLYIVMPLCHYVVQPSRTVLHTTHRIPSNM